MAALSSLVGLRERDVGEFGSGVVEWGILTCGVSVVVSVGLHS